MEEEDLRPIETVIAPKLEQHSIKITKREKMLSMLKLYPDGLSGSDLCVKCNIPNNGSVYLELKLMAGQGLITIKKCQCGQGKIYKLK